MSQLNHPAADWQKIKSQGHGFYSVFGVFEFKDDMEAAIERLRNQGFDRDAISVVMPEKLNSPVHQHHINHGKEGAAAGVATGAVLGGTLGWLMGIGAFAVPGVGPILAIGPILATLTGAGVGLTVGGISGALVGYGIPEMEAKKIEEKIQGGGILLSVHCNDSDWMNRAQKQLEIAGAKDIASTYETEEAH